MLIRLRGLGRFFVQPEATLRRTFSRRVGQPVMRSFQCSGLAGWLVAVGMVLALAGCASTPPAEASIAGDLGSHEWVLAEINGNAVRLSPEVRPTLRFDAESKRVTGFGGVNRINGTYVTNGAELKFGPILATKMAGPPPQNEVETALLRALEAVTGWRIVRERLELLQGERVVARFSPLPEGAAR